MKVALQTTISSHCEFGLCLSARENVTKLVDPKFYVIRLSHSVVISSSTIIGHRKSVDLTLFCWPTCCSRNPTVVQAFCSGEPCTELPYSGPNGSLRSWRGSCCLVASENIQYYYYSYFFFFFACCFQPSPALKERLSTSYIPTTNTRNHV